MKSSRRRCLRGPSCRASQRRCCYEHESARSRRGPAPSPISPRWTASGFTRINVRSICSPSAFALACFRSVRYVRRIRRGGRQAAPRHRGRRVALECVGGPGDTAAARLVRRDDRPAAADLRTPQPRRETPASGSPSASASRCATGCPSAVEPSAEGAHAWGVRVVESLGRALQRCRRSRGSGARRDLASMASANGLGSVLGTHSSKPGWDPIRSWRGLPQRTLMLLTVRRRMA